MASYYDKKKRAAKDPYAGMSEDEVEARYRAVYGAPPFEEE